MRDEEGKKKEASKVKQTIRQSNTASTPKAVTFPKKNELPQVGLQPTTLYTLDRALMYVKYSKEHEAKDQRRKGGVDVRYITMYIHIARKVKQDPTSKRCGWKEGGGKDVGEGSRGEGRREGGATRSANSVGLDLTERVRLQFTSIAKIFMCLFLPGQGKQHVINISSVCQALLGYKLLIGYRVSQGSTFCCCDK